MHIGDQRAHIARGELGTGGHGAALGIAHPPPQAVGPVGLAGIVEGVLGATRHNNSRSIKGPGGQAIMRAYLDLVNAAHALHDAEYNQSTLDLGIREFTWHNSAGAATAWCFVFSAFVSIVFVPVAVLISIWGINVHGVPTENITALAAFVDGVQLVSNYTDTTCSIESQNTFKLDKFLGYPDTKVFWNLYGGL
eukprot:7110148-Prymnesium_polylepis.2